MEQPSVVVPQPSPLPSLPRDDGTCRLLDLTPEKKLRDSRPSKRLTEQGRHAAATLATPSLNSTAMIQQAVTTLRSGKAVRGGAHNQLKENADQDELLYRQPQLTARALKVTLYSCSS